VSPRVPFFLTAVGEPGVQESPIMAKKQPAPVVSDTPAPEGYTVLARRYRPQGFGQLVGQEHVVQSLENALKSGRVAHAYLFTGARGVGKTSTARILAKCLNCEKGPTTTPCDQCDMCKSITSGEDIDVLEIDGASNRGIDNIRDLRNNVQFRPSRSRFKIYIIDEVHMLTKEAFNALLKTLEEPPPHIKFIFATTEAQKIPLTILSRCQRFDFAGIGVSRIVERLRDIVQKEGRPADEEALEMIARRAAGSMRDAQSLLDQLLAFGSERLTADQIHALLGTAGDDRIAALAQAVLAHDARAAVEQLADIAEKTLQPGELLDQLMAYWRDLMVAHVAGNEAKDLSVPNRYREELLRQAASLTLDTILAGLEVLNSARFRLKSTTHGRLIVEMALVRLCQMENLAPVSQLAQLLSQTGGGSPPAATGARPVAPPEGLKKKMIAAPSNGEPREHTALTADTLPQIWSELLQSLPPLMAGQLEKALAPAISGPNMLVVRFPLAYNGEREYCQDSTRVQRIEASLQKITGCDWKLRVEALPADSSERVISPPLAPPDVESGLVRARRLREEAEKEPLIKRAMELLGAQVVRVDEDFNSGGSSKSPSPPVSEPEGEEAVGSEEM
jgi:DNA polymerase-3 subunit gamma/tau